MAAQILPFSIEVEKEVLRAVTFSRTQLTKSEQSFIKISFEIKYHVKGYELPI